jgi:DNA-binding MarR family transcriptional regulator
MVLGVPATVAADLLAQVEDALAAIVRQIRIPRLYDRIAVDAGLTLERGAYPVLRLVEETGSTRLSQLAQVLNLDLSTVSRHVKQLERAGLVARTGDKLDARASLLRVTAKGRRAVAAVNEAWRRFIAEVLADWRPGDVAALGPLLERLAHDMSTVIEGQR